MVKVNLYFFEENVLLSKNNTSWNDASKVIVEHISDKIDELKYQDQFCEFELTEDFLKTLKEKALLFKNCQEPVIVCGVLISIFEDLKICRFDKKMCIGGTFFIRGIIDDKKFLIEIFEEV